MIRLLALSLLLAAPASAQEFPSLFDVTGVASNDVLNVRESPSAAAPIVGTLAPDARAVEVVGADPSGHWALVNVGETAGWASLAYLTEAPASGDYLLERDLSCGGTEPFWSLDITQGAGARFNPMEGQAEDWPAGLVQMGAGRTDRFLIGLGDGRAAVLSRGYCSDGMSDLMYGLEINVLSHPGGLTLWNGCCSIAPR